MVSATPAGVKDLEMNMEIRAYRSKATDAQRPKRAVQSLWSFLQNTHALDD